MSEFDLTKMQCLSNFSSLRIESGAAMPTVSVIMSTYNRSEVLRWAIESVRAQTFADWELIVIGDALTDDSEAVVASFADDRISFFNRSSQFGEQSGPNNDGFALSRGKYISYLNHDDLWFPDHLDALTGFIEESGADLVHALPLSVDAHGEPYCGVTNEELLYDPSHFIPASLWLAKRELIERLEGWRPAREVYASNPSQDVLYRAWNLSRIIRCHPRFTAVIFASGSRPGSYVTKDDSQHRLMMENMRQCGYREQLITRLAVRSAREIESLRRSGITSLLNRLVDRGLVKLKLHPNSVRNRLAGRKKGWWIQSMRNFRGLPPIELGGR